jgi:hypothetical protein
MPKKQKYFIKTLYHVINDPSNRGIIEWEDDGLSFHIVNRLKFRKNILKPYFNYKNFCTFIRTLKTFKFYRTNIHTLKFANLNFQRGRTDLLKLIKNEKGSLKNAESECTRRMPEKCMDAHSIMIKALKDICKHARNVNDDLFFLCGVVVKNFNMWKPTILIYEENCTLRSHIKIASKMRNFNIYIAETRNDIITFVNSKLFDLIVIDKAVGDIFDLLKEVVKINFDTTLFVLGESFCGYEFKMYKQFRVDELILKACVEEKFEAVLDEYNFYP